MHELLNNKTGKVIRFAEDVHELTPDEYLFYLDLVLQYMSGQITDPQEVKRRLFSKLTGLKISFRMFFYKPELIEAIWSAVNERVNLLDSFFDITETKGKPEYAMHVKCTSNLLPRWNGWTGPENLLYDITWGQFKQCVNALKLLNQAQEAGELTEAERYTTDIFRALYKVPQKMKHCKKQIPDTVQFHALTYFSYWYELITTCPIGINGEDVDFSVLWKQDPDEPANEQDKSGWLGISFAIAESGVFGDLDDVDNQKLYKVLMFLYKEKMNTIFRKEQNNTSEND
ncbi:MAG TPA: hypothetical protein VK152_06660 [Paludibacter sp.]|nr:hypothetical protein [Paludibacter sp.]